MTTLMFDGMPACRGAGLLPASMLRQLPARRIDPPHAGYGTLSGHDPLHL
jgi:hypothetical protein